MFSWHALSKLYGRLEKTSFLEFFVKMWAIFWAAPPQKLILTTRKYAGDSRGNFFVSRWAILTPTRLLLLGKFKILESKKASYLEFFVKKWAIFWAASPRKLILTTRKYTGNSRGNFFVFLFQDGQFWPLPDFFCLESSKF